MNRSANKRRQQASLAAVARKPPGPSNPKRLGETLILFDDMIRLLDDSSLTVAAEAGLPSEPLPSLLQQCERIASRADEAEPHLVVAFPGLPPLQADWWRGHAPGLSFHRLPEPSDEGGGHFSQAVVRALQEECAREGREPFFLATPSAFSAAAFGPARMRLLVCHPWQAYAAAGPATGLSIDGFCAALSASLSHLPEHERLNYEDIGASREERIRVLLGRQASADAREGGQTRPLDYFGGAPAYEALCARFGYDPHSIADLDRKPASATAAPLAAAQGGHARFSWFLPRVAALLPESTARCRALLPLIDAALAADSVPEALDALFAPLEPQDRALAMLLAAAHFTRKGEALQALGLVAEALEEAPPQAQSLTALGASLYLDLDSGRLALEALASGLRRPGLMDPSRSTLLDTALYGEAGKKPDGGEHGQALLISRLQDMPPLPLARKRLMVEIGTTRENVPGQGSTRKLAQLCADMGLDFVTVDMDPSNSRRAQRLFKRLGLPFRAITAKGEDYLAAHPGPIDFIFLDAYDFYHGNHSEQRQSRYERYLGDRISDAACHQMHLDCARALDGILAEDGLICFDDTWTDANGCWTAKGTTAMPFLLENGFEVIDARNRAALLRRRKG